MLLLNNMVQASVSTPIAPYGKVDLDQINIVLIIFSAIVAWSWPIETFVLAYAFLGPLHYLTEISWLHNRKYFVPQSFPALPIIFTTCALALTLSPLVMQIAGPIVWLLLLLSSALVLSKNKPSRLLLMLIAALTPLFFSKGLDFLFFVSVLVPTLIHVFVFTALFMLFGAIKTHSKLGYFATAALLIFGAVLFIPTPDASHYAPAAYFQNAVKAFGSFPVIFAAIFHRHESWSGQVAVMRFIGFAYLYHYLNWFSKTRVIGWHEVSKQRAQIIMGLYLLFIAIYAYDYVLGFQVAFFLSLAHVLLEFPLNVHSLAGILRGRKS